MFLYLCHTCWIDIIHASMLFRLSRRCNFHVLSGVTQALSAFGWCDVVDDITQALLLSVIITWRCREYGSIIAWEATESGRLTCMAIAVSYLSLLIWLAGLVPCFGTFFYEGYYSSLLLIWLAGLVRFLGFFLYERFWLAFACNKFMAYWKLVKVFTFWLSFGLWDSF